MTKRRWSVVELARNIHRIEINLARVGDEQWVLLQSDVHWDNPKCLQDLVKTHLDEAKDRDAPVLDNGDWFCAMQGKWDQRANKHDLRPEHQRADYLDALVATAADFLAPYASILTVRGKGNHETAIEKRHETNLTDRLVERLRMRGSESVRPGGYSGFVVFQTHDNGNRRRPFKMFYHHGYGGGGPVTRGSIQTSRMAVFLADADLVWTGHTHDSWTMPIARVRLNQDCTLVEHIRQEHIRTSGYKEDFRDGHGGWHIERGMPPKPIGAKWLRFYVSKWKTVEYDVIEAK